MTFTFILNSVLLGIGLAMDAFSVSMANGLSEPHMKKSKMHGIAAVFGVFQFLMPMLGWVCVYTMVEKFRQFEKFIPWTALVLLAYIGGKMIIEGIRTGKEQKNEENAEKTAEEAPQKAGENAAGAVSAECADGTIQGTIQKNAQGTVQGTSAEHIKETAVKGLTFGTLIMQGIATSIDALSVGFTIAGYDAAAALVSTGIIGLTTYIISVAGVIIGKRFGTKLSDKASILGGIILVLIGVEIFVKGLIS